MNPAAGATAPLPLRAPEGTQRRHRAGRRLQAHRPGHRRAAPRHAGADRRGAGPGAAGAVVLPGHRRRAGAAPGLRRLAAAALRRQRRPADADAAGQRLARGAVCAGADADRPDAARRHRGLPQSRSIRSTKGAALLAGAQTAFANSDPARNFAADWSQIDDATWARTQLLYVCSPGNPTGAVMPLSEWRTLFELSDRHGFVIASDECYSEIYFRRRAAAGLAAGRQGARPRRLPQPGGLHQPVQALQRAGAALRLRRRRRRGCSRPSCCTAPTTAAR